MSNILTPSISSIVFKVWAFCNTLRDVGVGYGNCLNQDFQDDGIYRMHGQSKVGEEILTILKFGPS